MIETLIIEPFTKILADLGFDTNRIIKNELKTEGPTFFLDNKKNALFSIDYLIYEKKFNINKSNTIGKLYFNKIHEQEALENIVAKLPQGVKDKIIKVDHYDNGGKGLSYVMCTVETMEKLFEYDWIVEYFQEHYNNPFSGTIDLSDEVLLLDGTLVDLKRVNVNIKAKIVELSSHNIDNLNELRRLEEKIKDEDKIIREIMSNRIERGTISKKVKVLTNYRCLACEQLGMPALGFKKKQSDEYYIESQHVIPVSSRKKGSLSATNIITLCANHHRQMHYGNVSLEDNEDSFVFQLDGQRIEIQKIKIPDSLEH